MLDGPRPDPWLYLIARSGLRGSGAELEWNKAIKGLEDMPIFPPPDLSGSPLGQLRLTSGGSALLPLIRITRRAQKAITERAAYRTLSAPPGHIADTWGDSLSKRARWPGHQPAIQNLAREQRISVDRPITEPGPR